jgi:succinyl-diaminopimelate desuccinylase
MSCFGLGRIRAFQEPAGSRRSRAREWLAVDLHADALMDTLTLAKELIKRPSVTPEDAGCQALVADLLQESGFKSEHLRFEDVDNLWAVHGEGAPIFCFLGHTDVVPTGAESDWKHPPFTPTEEDGMLYGRGAADMKGGVAVFVNAARTFVAKNPQHKGTVAVLLTSDEEGPGIHGTAAVMREFEKRNLKIDYCLVGEPSSEKELGDVVKVGRRGSISGTLQIIGVQGHVAYPHLARNPLHQALPALTELAETQWDNGNEFFPPTSFQISNIQAGTGADNVIPGRLHLVFNLRYSSELHADQIKSWVHEILDRHKLEYELVWRHSGLPFLTGSGNLVEAISKSIETETGNKPLLSTAGGTSDGRFVAPTGAQVAEFGLINRTIHKVDEHICIAHLEKLERIYVSILENLLAT